jgi:arabinose-5-phosphate isomerase
MNAPVNRLAYARSVLEAEARAVLQVGERLGQSFERAVDLLQSCRGSVVATGLGKAGVVAQKLSATLASTGVPSFYLHPTEAAHGDLGRLRDGDVVVALSNSGATEELLRLVPIFRRMQVSVLALTGNPGSPLGRGADLVLDIGPIAEACPLGLVPTASTAALLALSDALAMTLLKVRPFTHDAYAALHPAGALGRAALRVADIMRAGAANPVAHESAALSAVVVVMTNTPGRPGAANIVDGQGRLTGIFTDGDLRRLVERGQTRFDVAVGTVMSKRPRAIPPDALVADAVTLMRDTQVDQLPVLDTEGKPVGLLDVQDVLAALPRIPQSDA